MLRLLLRDRPRITTENLTSSHLLPVILIAVLSVLPYRDTLNSQGLLAIHDMILPPNFQSLVTYVANSSHTWNAGVGPNIDVALGFIVSIGILPILLFSLPGGLWWVGVTFLSGISSYVLVFEVSKGRSSAIVGGMFYAYSPYFFNNLLAGFSGAMIAYFLFPLALFCVVRGVYPWKISCALGCGMLIGIMSMVDTTAAGMMMLLLLIWFVSVLLVSKRTRLLDRVLQMTKFFAVSVATTVGVTMIWLLPAILSTLSVGAGNTRPDLSYHGTAEELALWSRFLTPTGALLNLAPSDFLSLVRSSGLEWVYIATSAIIASLSFSLLLFRKDKSAIFVTLSLLVASTLGAGLNLPISAALYTSLYGKSVIFAPFNRPYFFQAITTVCQAMALGILTERAVRKSGRSSRRLLVVGLLSIVILINVAPSLTGSFNGELRLVSLPSYYTDSQTWLQAAPAGKILLLPPYTDLRNGPFTFQNPLAVFSQKEVISLQEIQTNPFIPFAINSLYLGRTETVATLLGMMGVRYVVVDLSAPDFPWAPFQQTTQAYAFLTKAPGLAEVWSEGPMHIFEDRFQFPNVIAPASIAFTAGDMRLMAVLSTVPSVDFKNLGIIYANQQEKNEGAILTESSMIMVQDNDWNDIILSTMRDRITISLLSDATALYHYGDGWTTSLRVLNPEVFRKPYFFDMAYADPSPWVLSEAVAHNVSMSSSFVTQSTGTYQVWARIFQGFATVSLSDPQYLYEPHSIQFSVDGQPLPKFNTFDPTPGKFVWSNLGTISLTPGRHALEIVNPRSLAIVSKVVLVAPDSYQSARTALTNQLSRPEMGSMEIMQTPDSWLNKTISVKPYALPPNFALIRGASYGLSVNSSSAVPQYRAEIMADGKYSIEIRVASNETSSIEVTVDDITRSTFLVGPGPFTWHQVASVDLSVGNHTIEVRPLGGRTVAVDAIMINAQKESTTPIASGDVVYRQASSAEYSVNINCSSRCSHFIVLLEPYAQLWKSAQGTESIAVFSYANGFLIDSGSTHVDILFMPERAEQYGLVISVATILLVTLTLSAMAMRPIWKRRQKSRLLQG